MEQKTLRDEFAMAALTGMEIPYFPNKDEVIADRHIERMTEIVYRLADAMMKEREKYNKE